MINSISPASFILIISLFVGFGFLAAHFFVDLPYKRKKEQEELLKASSAHQEGTWPPAPTTYQEPPELEYWAWCMICERASTMDAIEDNGGYCMYEDCSAYVSDMVSWHDLHIRLPEIPEQPEVGVVYTDLVQVRESETSGEPNTFSLSD